MPLRFYEAIVQRSSDIAVVADWEGTITFASPAVSILGYEPGDVVGRRVRDFVHPDDAAVGAATIQEAVTATGMATIEWRIRAADGTWRYVEEAITDLTMVAEVGGLVINLRDITRRREAEEARSESERQLALLFDASPIGTAVVGTAGHLMRVNDALVELLGYPRHELLNLTFGDVTHPDDIEDDTALYEQLMDGRIGRYQIVKRYLCRDGSEILGRLSVSALRDNDGRPLHAIGSIEDITETVEAHRRLAQNEQRLVMALDAAGMATWEREMSSGRLVVSENFYDVYGLGPDDFDGTFEGLARLMHRDDVTLISEIDDGNDSFAMDHRFMSPTRGPLLIHGRGRRERDTSGNVVKVIGTVMDVTSERLAQRQHLEAEQMFRRTIEATTDAFIGIDAQGAVRQWNASATRVFGWTADEARGRQLEDLIIPPELRSAHRAGLSQASDLRRIGRLGRGPVEMLAHTRSGSSIPVEISVVSVEIEDELRFNAFVRDISARKAAEAELELHAITDELTGLPNRALLSDRFDTAIRRRSADRWIALLFIDIDRLNVVNDSIGHHAGDAMIRAVAERISSLVQPPDTVARFGGDELVVLMETVQSLHEATCAATAILAAVGAPLTLDGHQIEPTVTIGLTMSTVADAHLDDLLRDADVAMYRAKTRGRNRYEIFDISMRGDARMRFQLEAELRHAIAGESLTLHYQPVVSPDGSIQSAEALVRWDHPERGLLPPAQFIPLAEETGLIIPLGDWALRTACHQTAVWRRTLAPNLGIAVNVSAHQLEHPDFFSCVESALADTELDPKALCLELTESTLMRDPTASAAVLGRIHALGVRLAVDDFGTGYSSLLYLRNFPVQVLKLDRMFVSGLGTNSGDDTIVGSTIQLAHALHLSAVAEGVETQVQHAALHTLGCDHMQGYLWSKPVDPQDFTRLLGPSGWP
jgi:diguanylate cyclase (GGDEF)-like protein/PAS domain S-box-containing protein